MYECDIAVIGGGPAGLAAAIEAKKHGAGKVLLIDRDIELGGILQQCVHNGFGLHIFREELTGTEYAERFIKELKDLGIEYKLDTMVLSITQEKVISMVNKTEGIVNIRARAVILAMGCRERTRGALNIPGTRPSGIFTAGTAQRFINKEGYMVGRNVVILGSGDIGMIMARRLTLEGARVRVVAEALPYPGGLVRNVVQCLNDFDIPLLLNHTIVDIKGKDRIEGVIIAEVDENRKPIDGRARYYECDTLLLSVGLIPENELSKGIGVKLDPVTGGPVVNESMETTVKGIFACGNVVHVHDIVDYVTEESRKAGRSAALFVNEKGGEWGTPISTRPGNGIRYIVPHLIREDKVGHSVDLFMRVDKIFTDKKLVVKSGDTVIRVIKKAYMRPGEMERISIAADSLKAADNLPLTVDVE
ncbi:MAG: FAD-dependent oxidoreductase [Gracilibacteraceae bacterium]|jgi:NADPH-dependent 2,4-dienoyl-CoA reductase/sulfur reductase-like enzyme|nr:FAD-dependent oxidoreductase [Gracilibacteraceae bacterium]